MKNQLHWHEMFDDSDNSYWEAASQYFLDDDGAPFNWRLKQRIVGNKIEWYEAHDAELLGDSYADSWPDIETAKAEIQKAYENIISDNSVY